MGIHARTIEIHWDMRRKLGDTLGYMHARLVYMVATFFIITALLASITSPPPELWPSPHVIEIRSETRSKL